MSTLRTLAGAARLVQFTIAIILLGINGKLKLNTSTLTSSVKVLDSIASLNGSLQSFNIDTFWKANFLGVSSGSFSALAQALLSFIPKLFKNGGKSQSYQLSDCMKRNFGIKSAQTGYLMGISLSELVSIVLWFACCVYFTSKFGNWDCTDSTRLLFQYNLTSDAIQLAASEYWGFSAASERQSGILNGDVNYTLPNIDIGNIDMHDTALPSTVNATDWLTKQQLLLQLQQDCQFKKVSIALSYAGFATFLVSSWFLSYSAVTLYTELARRYVQLLDIETTNSPIGEVTDSTNTSHTSDEETENDKHELALQKSFRLDYSFAQIFPSVDNLF